MATHIFRRKSLDRITEDAERSTETHLKRSLGAVDLVSLGIGGAEANGDSEWPACDATGGVILFGSRASNLVVGDTNGKRDVFVGQ